MAIPSNNSNKNNLLAFIFSSQKLQKSEQEDFAGNYFKPKRATELLIRAKEDAGRAVSKWAGELLGTTVSFPYNILSFLSRHKITKLRFKVRE